MRLFGDVNDFHGGGGEGDKNLKGQTASARPSGAPRLKVKIKLLKKKWWKNCSTRAVKEKLNATLPSPICLESSFSGLETKQLIYLKSGFTSVSRKDPIQRIKCATEPRGEHCWTSTWRHCTLRNNQFERSAAIGPEGLFEWTSRLFHRTASPAVSEWVRLSSQKLEAKKKKMKWRSLLLFRIAWFDYTNPKSVHHFQIDTRY